jgi:hypothetical protein
MDACMAAMTAECSSCNVPPGWPSALYYLVLLPGAFVAAVWSANRKLARGVAAVLFLVLVVGGVFPLLLMIPFALPLPGLGEMLVFWPQYVFFGPGLTGSRGPVLPAQHAYLVTLGFWAVLALVFGLLTKGLRSAWLACSLAVVWVAGTTYAIRLIVPFFHWTLHVTNEL